MTYARVVIVLRLYLLEQCLNPVLWTSIKTCNIVTFYKFLIHLGVHHTYCIFSRKKFGSPSVTVMRDWLEIFMTESPQDFFLNGLKQIDNFKQLMNVCRMPTLSKTSRIKKWTTDFAADNLVILLVLRQ